ncbi:MAG: glutamate 5-kinase [Gammaproteobacteria bacterium]|jgi:glutamate 5-kinase
MSESRKKIKQTKRWVVKLGSALLTNNGCGLRVDSLDAWVKQIHELRQKGHEIVIVSSGATAEGITRLGWKKRPHAVHELQAAAAVGQMGLIKAWESCFQNYQIHTAQILLTHEVISNRERYLNARSTLRTLLQLGVVPIVNENDTVSTEELRFGDNDTLAGLVTHLVDADLLVLLTDQEGLYEADPRLHPQAKYISEATAGDKSLENYAGEGGILGRGGMLTKLKAASMAAKSGASTIIASGHADNVLIKIANGEACGTLLSSNQEALTARKQWLAGQSQSNGRLKIDQGAADVLTQQGKSLLAVGVVEVEGEFNRGEIVVCIDPQGKEIARGLVNYSATETRKIMGQPSNKFESLLGYVDSAELIHRDDLILI